MNVPRHSILFFIAFSVLLTSACSDRPKGPQIQPVYKSSLQPAERAIAEKAYAVFCETCRPLMSQYTADIESIEIGYGVDRVKRAADDGCDSYRCRDYGWDKHISVELKLKDKLSVIPREYYAQGHRLAIGLGGPQNPGITVPKKPQLCGGQKRADSLEGFIPAPALASILK